jgi:TonB family protein
MHLDFHGRYVEYDPVGGGLRWWDGVLLSVVVHAVLIAVALFLPTLAFFDRSEKLAQLEEKLAEKRERPQFVFVQPKVDLPAAKPRARSEASDLDRTSRTPQPAPAPQNELPYARGNSADRVESSPDERARGKGPEPEPAPEPPKELPQRTVEPPDDRQARLTLPQQETAKPSGGSLGEALKNLQKYVQQDSFNNQRGNVQDLGPLQFDTKGVEFGPWIRRFVSQVRRNWFIPYAAMTMRGRVVLTFNVHRNGMLTDVQVVQPSPIESFNIAAVNALIASNPTQPLPPEYPEDKAFFTVTFYYNESPGP